MVGWFIEFYSFRQELSDPIHIFDECCCPEIVQVTETISCDGFKKETVICSSNDPAARTRIPFSLNCTSINRSGEVEIHLENSPKRVQPFDKTGEIDHNWKSNWSQAYSEEEKKRG